MSRKPNPLQLLTEPGTVGNLELRAETDEHGLVTHAARARYVGVVRGLHAFSLAPDDPVVFLHRSEVVSFRPA